MMLADFFLLFSFLQQISKLVESVLFMHPSPSLFHLSLVALEKVFPKYFPMAVNIS